MNDTLNPCPKGWSEINLSNICQPRKDSVDPAKLNEMPYIGLEHLDSGSLSLSRWDSSKKVRSAKTRFQPGDVLYGKLRPYLDKAVLAPWQGICSTELIALQTKSQMTTPEFLANLVHTQQFIQHAIDTTTGTNLPRTSWNSLKEYLFFLPPLSEQRNITHVLRAVQQAKEATEKVIAAAQTLKQSLMRHLFTYGPVPFHEAHKVALKETEIGKIPNNWDVCSIKDVGEVKISTSTLKVLEKAEEGKESVFYLKVSDMNHPLNQQYIRTAAIIYNVKNEAIARLNVIPKGATVLPKRGAAIATNKKRLTTCNCLLDPNLVAVIPGNNLEADYLYAWFIRFDLRNITDTTTLPQINKKDIEPLLIPVPNLEDQRRMTELLNIVDRKVEQEKARLNALDSLFNSLLQFMMTGEIRV